MSDARRDKDAPAAEVLRERAATLARPTASQPQAEVLQVLGFTAAGQHCLLELGWLREVQTLRDLAPLPLAAPHLLGLAPWRGRMLPVLDLASLLATRPSPEAASGCLLVLGRETACVALAVSGIHGVQALRPDEVERRSQPLEGLRPDIVRGVSAHGQLLLDAERLLSVHRGAAP